MFTIMLITFFVKSEKNMKKVVESGKKCTIFTL